MTDADAIVDKFFFKGEIKEKLRTEIEDKTHRIDDMKKELAAAKDELQLLRQQHRDHTWRDVEALSENRRQVESQVDREQKDTEKLRQMLTYVQVP